MFRQTGGGKFRVHITWNGNVVLRLWLNGKAKKGTMCSLPMSPFGPLGPGGPGGAAGQ